MNKRLNNYCLLLATLSFVLFSTNTAVASDEKPPAMAEMWHFKVDPADQKNFEKALEAHAKYRKEKGDPRNWRAYTPHTGVIGRDYYVRHCCFKWGQHQDYTELKIHDDLGKNWIDGPGKYVKKTVHFYSWSDHENSHWPENTKSNLLRLVHYKLKVGSDISPVVKEISDLAKKVGWKRAWGWSYERTMDGVYLTLAMPSEDFAGLEPVSPSFDELVEKELGKDGLKKLFDRFDEHVESTGYRMMRYRPEFSVMK